MTSPDRPSEHVVIIGAGFAGLACAQRLGRAGIRTTVVDRRNHHLFVPLLYQVATAALSPADIAEPVRLLMRDYPSVDVRLDEVTAIGAEIGATPAQTALAWILSRGDDIAPIPGTRRVARVEENTAADGIRLSPDQIARLEALEPAAGARHDDANMASIDR